MDEGTLKYFAVFGNPVLHSRSPQLYNSLFLYNKVNAFYTRILVQTGREVCEIVRMLGLAGANVTTPFKEEVIPYLDKLSPDAERIQAVNTIVNREGKLTGYNTDGAGISGSLHEEGIVIADSKSMVIGAGGAGKAAALGLVKAGSDVLITNRSAGKAFDFAKNAGCRFADLDKAMKMISEFDIVVLALPPGIYPFEADHISKKMTLVDANYRSPSETAGLESYSCRVIRGDRWLLYQAVEAYRLFTGKRADIGTMEKGMKENLVPDRLVIKVIKDIEANINLDSQTDMLIDGRGLDDDQINGITDEERSKTFGDKG